MITPIISLRLPEDLDALIRADIDSGWVETRTQAIVSVLRAHYQPAGTKPLAPAVPGHPECSKKKRSVVNGSTKR